MAQVHKNGRADIVGSTIQLGDFLPEKRKVVLNGQAHDAWVVTNGRYPRRIMLELEQASRSYTTAIEPLRTLLGRIMEPDILAEIMADPVKQAALDAQPLAWDRYITDCILALIPTMLESELELVGLGNLEQLLRDLGYLQPLDANDDESVEAAESQVTPLTGDSLLQDLPDSTQATT